MLSLVFGTTFPEHFEPLPQEVQLKISGANTESSDIANEEVFTDVSSGQSLKIKIYPNPANQTVIIDFALLDSRFPIELVVYNIFGKKIYSERIEQSQGVIRHDITGLPDGVYLYTLLENSQVAIRKKITIIK